MRTPALKNPCWTAAGWAVVAVAALAAPAAATAGLPMSAADLAAPAAPVATRIISFVDGVGPIVDGPGKPGDEGQSGGGDLSATAARRQCTDGAYSRTGWRVSGTLKWYYNGAGAPSSVSRTAAKTTSTAVSRLVKGYNDCGLKRSFKVGQKYAGTSRRAPAVTATSCGKQDGYSVVGWKKLPSSVLAVTCAWSTAGDHRVVSTDIAINTRYKWFTTKPGRCSNTFDLESVLSHEWGHAFGLGHVSLSSHGTQTMATAVGACTTAKRTLGLGDYRGMQRIYGLR
ncbi:matrixin family metalloprotease [Actinomadura hibisca]|uniref:matrixin family metalloprotease n=1 Tax=Actinomadura hibisca TaxID=68565 RepID=UPI000A051D28|nr:matrixin family metalloprotease [Actinomadura hibisca]